METWCWSSMKAHHATPGPWEELWKSSPIKKDMYAGSRSGHKMALWKGPSQSCAFYKTWPDETSLTYDLPNSWKGLIWKDFIWTVFLYFFSSPFFKQRSVLNFFVELVSQNGLSELQGLFFVYFMDTTRQSWILSPRTLECMLLMYKCMNCPIPVN